MVKTSTPVFSPGAAGTLAKLITFYDTRRRHAIRKRVRPRDPRTRDQRSRRAMFAFLTSQWQLLYAATQASWIPHAINRYPSAYLAYVAHNLHHWHHFLPPSMFYPATRTGALGTIVSGPDALLEEHRYRFQFRLNPLSFAWGLMIFARPQTGFDTNLDNLIAVYRTRVTYTQTWYWDPPDFGNWFFNARQFSVYGLLGPELGEFTPP